MSSFQSAHARFIELWDRFAAGGSAEAAALEAACDELDVQRIAFLGHGAGSVMVKLEIDRARAQIEPIPGIPRGAL